ncbi:MAG: hypothetical protein CSYNP_00241 [Syntrophus sp. SKADARSKE-3]|nr:hypothetical protein [Syntrophus sp. SKADARSKE-3]
MTSSSCTHQKLLEENAYYKKRILELEESESKRIQLEEALKDRENQYRFLYRTSRKARFCLWLQNKDGNGCYRYSRYYL